MLRRAALWECDAWGRGVVFRGLRGSDEKALATQKPPRSSSLLHTASSAPRRGSSGRVFLCLDINDQRLYAVKVRRRQWRRWLMDQSALPED